MLVEDPETERVQIVSIPNGVSEEALAEMKELSFSSSEEEEEEEGEEEEEAASWAIDEIILFQDDSYVKYPHALDHPSLILPPTLESFSGDNNNPPRGCDISVYATHLVNYTSLHYFYELCSGTCVQVESVNGTRIFYATPKEEVEHIGHLLLFHGGGGDGAEWFMQSEQMQFTCAALRRGFSIMSLDSETVRGPDEDADPLGTRWRRTSKNYERVWNSLAYLIATGVIEKETPLIPYSYSAGSGFATEVAEKVGGITGYPAVALGLNMAYDVRDGHFGDTRANNMPATAFIVGELDYFLFGTLGYNGPSGNRQHYSQLRRNGVDALYIRNPPKTAATPCLNTLCNLPYVSEEASNQVRARAISTGLLNRSGRLTHDPSQRPEEWYAIADNTSYPDDVPRRWIYEQARELSGAHMFTNEYTETTLNFFAYQATGCQLSPWTPWSFCRGGCGSGSGTQTRSRSIVARPTPTTSGRACSTYQLSETKVCNGLPCLTECDVGEWSDWTQCSRECGTLESDGKIGYRSRERAMLPEAQDQDGCPTCRTWFRRGNLICPALSQTAPCNSRQCGKREFDVSLEAHLATFGGEGSRIDEVEDPDVVIMGSCKMTKWSEWSECQGGCESGFQTRTRDIISIENRWYGTNTIVTRADANDCGETVESRTCSPTARCSSILCRNIVQSDTEWGEWGKCQLSDDPVIGDNNCRGGVQKRDRIYTNMWPNRSQQYCMMCSMTSPDRCPAFDQSRPCNLSSCRAASRTTYVTNVYGDWRDRK